MLYFTCSLSEGNESKNALLGEPGFLQVFKSVNLHLSQIRAERLKSIVMALIIAYNAKNEYLPQCKRLKSL